MGDAFYNNNGTLKRVELIYGDGASGKKVIPTFKNASGNTIEIPQISNMLLNLCRYSFSLNNRFSCSQYIDGSNLNIGKLQWSGVKTIESNSFQDKITEDTLNFTNIPTNQYALNTNKGVLFIKKGIPNGLGVLLPNNKELLRNRGDSFTLSYSFAYENCDNWQDVLQMIRNNSGRGDDGYFRVEQGEGNSLNLFYSQTSGNPSTSITLINNNSQGKILNITIRAKRNASTDRLLVDSWSNGVRKSTEHDFGPYRHSPINLFPLNTYQSRSDTPMNLFVLSLRVWESSLSDDEISMVQKIEARNLGREVLDANGLNLSEYLRA